MNFTEKIPYRKFKPSPSSKVVIKDCGKMELEANEQITFITKGNNEYDFTSKDWGFYVTPSINRRLLNEGFKTALVQNKIGNIYIMVVEKKKIDRFIKYCNENILEVIYWLNEWQKTNDNKLKKSFR